jgi:hypothetical protein
MVLRAGVPGAASCRKRRLHLASLFHPGVGEDLMQVDVLYRHFLIGELPAPVWVRWVSAMLGYFALGDAYRLAPLPTARRGSR